MKEPKMGAKVMAKIAQVMVSRLKGEADPTDFWKGGSNGHYHDFQTNEQLGHGDRPGSRREVLL